MFTVWPRRLCAKANGPCGKTVLAASVSVKVVAKLTPPIAAGPFGTTLMTVTNSFVGSTSMENASFASGATPPFVPNVSWLTFAPAAPTTPVAGEAQFPARPVAF